MEVTPYSLNMPFSIRVLHSSQFTVGVLITAFCVGLICAEAKLIKPKTKKNNSLIVFIDEIIGKFNHSLSSLRDRHASLTKCYVHSLSPCPFQVPGRSMFHNR